MLGDPLDDTRWALEYLTLDGVSHLVNGRRIPEVAFLDGLVLYRQDGVVWMTSHHGEPKLVSEA